MTGVGITLSLTRIYVLLGIVMMKEACYGGV